MNKLKIRLFVSCVILFMTMVWAFPTDAQTVEYYRWGKTRQKNGTEVQASPGIGQFVTRRDNLCWESDKQGYTVGHGSLKCTERKGNLTRYVGASYYGNNTAFTFNDAKGILNIEDAAGNIYIYYKDTPPAGQTTCSLLKNQGGSGSSSGGLPVSNAYTPTQHRVDCSICYGTGKCQTCHGKGYSVHASGITATCGACRGTKDCTNCDGTGKTIQTW